MFGSDHFVLSKPNQVKTIAYKFVENIKNQESEEFKFTELEKPKLNKPTILEKPKIQRIDMSILKKESINNIKPEQIKTVAKNFLNQINKLPSSPKLTDKLLFSYSDSKGKIGILNPTGEKVKVLLRKNKLKNFTEDIIEVYYKGVNVFPDGLPIQAKGWGNTRELSIANAIKNGVLKLSVITSDINEKVLLNYSLSTIQSAGDSGFECKVKITPGKI